MDPQEEDPAGTAMENEISPAAQYVLIFTPLVAMPLLVLLVRLLRFLWNQMQQRDEFGEREISNFHKKWRKGFAAFRYYMETSTFGRYWLITQVMLSVAACILYVVETYITNPRDSVAIVVITIILVTSFVIDYLIEFALAEDRLKYTVSMYGIVDALSIPSTIIPILSSSWVNDAIIQFLMIVRALRVFKVYKLGVFAEEERKNLLFSFFVSFGILVFLSTSLVNAVERYIAETEFPDPDLQNYHDSLYFMIISFTTVGYGDIVPSGAPTRVVVMILLVVYMIFLPINITRLAKSMENRGYRSKFFKKNKKHPFFVLTGNVTFDSVLTFARELYNNSLEDKSTQLVILASEDPDPQMNLLLKHPLFHQRLFYLTGSCTSSLDLDRANLRAARACAVFRGPFGSAPESEDHKILMSVVAIKKLFPEIPLFAQVQNSTEKEAVISTVCDRIFCLQELNLRMMARSCIAPGTSTLIANIFRSYLPLTSAPQNPWVAEYAKGCENVVNSFVFPKKYNGWTYSQVVLDLFNANNVTLLGIKSKISRSGYQGQWIEDDPIILNPTEDFEVREGDVGLAISIGRLTFHKPSVHHLNVIAPDDITRDPSPEPPVSLINESGGESVPLPSHEFRGSNRRSSLPRIAAPRPLQLNKKLLTSHHKVLSEPVSLEKATITSCKNFSDHIIVCRFKPSLSHFVSVLRLDSLRNHLQILIVDPNLPSEEEWNQVSVYPDVYFMKGDPTRFTVLINAGVKRCSRVVVLADETLPAESSDAANILIGKNLQEEDERIHEIIEIALEKNVEFLTPPTDSWVEKVQTTRKIVNDESQTYVKKSSLLDRHRVHDDSQSVKRQYIDVHSDSFADRLTLYGRPLPKPHLQPFFASGNAYLSSISDSFICQEIFRSFSMEIITKMICGNGGGQVFQIALPEVFEDKTYVDLFSWLLHRRILLIGLYRFPALDSDLPYVVANCPSDTVLRGRDRAFVLATKEPENRLL